MRNKSQENGRATLPRQCAYPMKPSLANAQQSHRAQAFEFLPGGLGVQTLAGSQDYETSCSQGGEAMQWFPERALHPSPSRPGMWVPKHPGVGGLAGPLHQVQGQDALAGTPLLWLSDADPTQHHGPFTCTSSQTAACDGVEVPRPMHSCVRDGYWVTSVDHREDRFSPGTSRSRAGKEPAGVQLVCVHLRVSSRVPIPSTIWTGPSLVLWSHLSLLA